MSTAARRTLPCCRSPSPERPRAGTWTRPERGYELVPDVHTPRGERTEMNRLVNHRRFVAVAAAGLLAAGVAACSSSSSPAATGSETTPAAASSGATLVMESSPETSIAQDFNPYATTAAIYGMGADGLIYEPLLQFDLAEPPTDYPYLATGYTWSNGGKTITFAIRQGVKWNNGTPFSPADVVFTFNLLKNNTGLNLDGLPITTVSASGN